MGIEALLIRTCDQTAVYWGAPVPDGSGGQTFATPVEIACRWENTNTVIVASDGREVVITAVVHLTQDVEEQGFLHLGALDDLDSDPEPEDSAVNAYEIRRFDKMAGMKPVTEFVRVAYL